MYQTAYGQLISIGRVRVPYVGGFCRWWYTPKQNIDVFPDINPATQRLFGEPVLKTGKPWYGPVNVPDRQLGWEEDMQRAKAGIFYKEKVVGFIPGMSAESHINIENLASHQVVIVGKARSGGNFYVLGDDQAGLDPDFNASTGIGVMDTPGTKIAFTGEQINKALILPSFSPIYSIPPPGTVAPAISPNSTSMETIHFTNVGRIDIAYTEERREKFGDYPAIEVWLLVPGTASEYYKSSTAEILSDNSPPSQTIFTVKPGEASTGFIILSP